jgi:hypothetical protein
MTFRSAAANQSRTENGMTTLASSLDPHVDLFFAIAASRGKDISNLFGAAYADNRDLALRILLWARDVRGGAGERQTFRDLLVHLEQIAPEDALAVIPFVAEFGRFDDLLVFRTDACKKAAFAVIARALLEERHGLAAKWMPRKGPAANELRRFLKLDPKGYRRLLVDLSDTVEQKLCAREFDAIEFGKLPSLASARYQKTFLRRCAERYAAYKEGLKSGTEKVNASAVYPHDVVKALVYADLTVSTAQWESLPNYLGEDFVLPMADVSASMTDKVGGAKDLACMDVSVSLSLYLADKQKGPFAGLVLTFSAKPTWVHLEGNLLEKYQQIRTADWGANTNLEAAFDEILDVAVREKVLPEQMPRYLLILSDMEFDAARRGGSPVSGGRRMAHPTAFELVAERFREAGYQLPKIVFWNLKARAGNNPVRYDQDGTALVSGFSPAIMRAILGAEHFDARSVMLTAVMDERYGVLGRGEPRQIGFV